MTKQILDACCGGKMFWFDKKDSRILSMDIRTNPAEVLSNRSLFEVVPDIVADFRKMPFPNDSFSLVLFDPPHLRCGRKSFLFKKYGTLNSDWKDTLRKGFSECFRVLRPNGTLIFKWCDSFKKLSEILELTEQKPVITHKTKSNSGKAFTYFVVFMKGGEK